MALRMPWELKEWLDGQVCRNRRSRTQELLAVIDAQRREAERIERSSLEGHEPPTSRGP